VNPKTDSALKKIFVLLRAQTGHDFSQYKPSTIHRRIDRRMAVQQIDDFDSYIKYLQKTPLEVEALFRDLLIGVTNFFRDPDAFQVLQEQIIPKLFEGKPAGAAVRVWSAGCSTGEEAYSLAILLVERMEALRQNYTLQVFATDIDNRAIARARAGQYPASIAADITPERLARFFVAEPGGLGYRIHKNIRDLLVFSEQDLIKDPPFSKMDLISCRNLLIYLDAELQKRVIPLFHYALKPGGTLFLGTSEGVGEFDALFSVVDRKSKIYARREDLQDMRRAALSGFISPVNALSVVPPSGAVQESVTPLKPPLRELTEQTILRQIAPASALVNAEGDILYLHGRTGMYLEPSPGEVGVQNILKMAREGLRPSLTTALHQTAATQRVVYAPKLSVKTNGHFTPVNLSVHPVPHPGGAANDMPLYLVMLEDVPAWASEHAAPAPPATAKTRAKARATTPSAAEARIQELTQELRAKDEYLQSTQEELESSNEELKSSNEEMQSVNEELQSSNEELETSKEELQSVNEELATVNAELQIKVTDLSRANDDMNNLLAGTGIGTLFIDHQLRILRFTPAISDIIHLIASDVGRPVTHFVAHLVGYTTLAADVQTVLKTLAPKQTEVQAQNGQWYNLRIEPYRTLNNVIEGAVISLADITALKQSEAALRHATTALQRMAVVVRDASDAMTLQDLEGRTLAWNPGAVRLYGWSEAQALQMNVRDRIPEGQRDQDMAQLSRLARNEVLQPYSTQRLTKSGAVVNVSIVATALLDDAGRMYAIATTERARPTVAP
jgi:two-component system CheB/CheR fusion protein